MACETRLRPRQTQQERAAEVKRSVDKLAQDIAVGRVKPVIGKTNGAIAFPGADLGKDGVSDACAFRKIMAGGNTAAKMAIARAEQLAGCSVSKQALAQGWHCHDGVWHKGH